MARLHLLGDSHDSDHVRIDGAVVLKCSRRHDGRAERLPLVEQATVFHALFEGDAIRCVVLVGPGAGS
jgi:hypothetical protein